MDKENAIRFINNQLRAEEQFSEAELSEWLTECVLSNSLDILQSLLKCGADPNLKSEGQMWSPLHLAIEHTNIDAVKILVGYGANVNQQDNYGFSPLHNSIDAEADEGYQLDREPIPQISLYLIKNGADRSIQDGEGKTPRDIAKKYDYRAALGFL